jgi:hypothetical protein
MLVSAETASFRAPNLVRVQGVWNYITARIVDWFVSGGISIAIAAVVAYTVDLDCPWNYIMFAGLALILAAIVLSVLHRAKGSGAPATTPPIPAPEPPPAAPESQQPPASQPQPDPGEQLIQRLVQELARGRSIQARIGIGGFDVGPPTGPARDHEGIDWQTDVARILDEAGKAAKAKRFLQDPDEPWLARTIRGMAPQEFQVDLRTRMTRRIPVLEQIIEELRRERDQGAGGEDDSSPEQRP